MKYAFVCLSLKCIVYTICQNIYYYIKCFIYVFNSSVILLLENQH